MKENHQVEWKTSWSDDYHLLEPTHNARFITLPAGSLRSRSPSPRPRHLRKHNEARVDVTPGAPYDASA